MKHSTMFEDYTASLGSKLEMLLKCQPLAEVELAVYAEKAGLYLFSEEDQHLYVGRTDDLKERIQTQRRLGSATNQAAFAYAIAKKELGIANVPYSTKNPTHPKNVKGFEAAFRRAKERVRAMTVRVVKESDPVGQALLEIYIHLRLQTPFNNFSNH